MNKLLILFTLLSALRASAGNKTVMFETTIQNPKVPAKEILSAPSDVQYQPLQVTSVPTASTTQRIAKPMSKRKSIKKVSEDGNLPDYYRNRDFSRLTTTSAAIIVPSPNLKSELEQVHVGDELRATIDHSIIAFPDESAPVIAKIRGGNLDGAKLIGASKLEPNTKRIFITFQTIVFHSKAYAFKANALTDDKQNGFEGEYHTQEGKLFAGDFISSTVAAYFDGLVPRQANVFGGQTADSSVDSALKKGASGGAMASADRFKEKLKKTPQFSELAGPISIEVLVLSKAIES